jgi:hypothetical protein
MSSWIYDNKPIEETDLEGYVGYVYLITNLTNGRKYIGKKLLKNRRTKLIKGKKKKILVDSDWKKYWGSNKVLIEDVNTLGEDNFKRVILRLCRSKGEANYWEAKYQMTAGVLESDLYYNDMIMLRVHRTHVLKKG